MRSTFVSSLFLGLVFLAAAPGITPTTERTAAQAALAVLDVTTHGDAALVHWTTGHYTVVPGHLAPLYSEYGNPEVVAHFSWISGGVEVVLDVRMQAGESEAKFGERCAKTVEVMKENFPPDPPPHN